MIYIKLAAGLPVEIQHNLPKGDIRWCSAWVAGESGNGWIEDRDIKKLTDAELFASKLPDWLLTVEDGSSSIKFSFVEKPKIGDKVSKSFNGDSYPCGEIAKITAGWQITTTTGLKFRRLRQEGSWKQVNSPFWMIPGHVDERNPHF